MTSYLYVVFPRIFLRNITSITLKGLSEGTQTFFFHAGSILSRRMVDKDILGNFVTKENNFVTLLTP